MSGFSAEWLSLREPVDHASLNGSVKRAMLNYLTAQYGKSLTNLHIMDLGCGTGSNLRSLSPFLGRHQKWTLVDYDPLLLKAAREALIQWADQTIADDVNSLQIKQAEREIHVTFLQTDLMQSYDAVLNQAPDLLTAAAFFDLVSTEWIAKFVAHLKSPLYTVLTYDGQESWFPKLSTDQAVLDAFIHHQQTDKGFGPAAGPFAGPKIVEVLQSHGYTVTQGASNWVLNHKDHHPLTTMLAQGIAQAVAQTGKVPKGDLNDWLGSRSQAQGCEIGHVDIFAAPSNKRPEKHAL